MPEFARLNRTWLGKDRPTNVISFAMQEGEGAGVQADLLGDVVISDGNRGARCRRGRGAVEQELYFLLLHGILHLLGYDHERGSGRRGAPHGGPRTGAVHPDPHGVPARVSQVPNRPHGFLGSLICAIEGVLWAVKTQRHMLVHLLAAVVVLLISLTLGLTLLEFALLALAIILVLFAELINTALEVVVDLVSPEYHPLAQRAKDVAAGAVLVASIGAVIMGYLALSRFFFPPDMHESSGFLRTTGNLAMVAVVLVVLLVVLLKARLGGGTPLHGGMPSGHAAVACSVATSVIFAAPGLPLLALAWMLAVLVAHSRVLLGVHSYPEVIVGGLLGSGVTLALHLVF